ncbi:exopolysaccharide biosynthesis polyprenyl glycosylphosphotransferase [uncultured Kushneria sp.]|uniref:exopolysaccharide biosynthesis polyprenyl glycosylphosphotransferase n=1 Tax=uncultured Kushneria sp. TaxID=905033 RepID=UPI00260D938F|nr:exopolysaccharide biosynthesis polyprenyl glycosylphosphotransferase [uncultured Kushneria sp.]
METFTNFMEQNRRHSRWYEKLLLSYRFNQALGLVIAVLLPAMFQWNWSLVTEWQAERCITLLGTALAYLVAIIAVHRLVNFPRTKAFLYIIPFITMSYIVMMAVLLSLQIELETTQIVLSYLIAVLYCSLGYQLSTRYRTRKLAVVPFGRVHEFCHDKSVDWRWLEKPDLETMRVDGVVADLRADLDDSWQKFLADCTIHRIPVFNARQIHESITGRVHLDHLYENKFGSLTPSENYELAKRVIDIFGVLLVLPVVLPIMLATIIIIKRDDPGPAFFNQQRMGFHCRPFKLFKFRSMYMNHEGLGFTSEGEDPRITRVGKVIRKYRIDELPQLFNVLKGDMSLIGPRPESCNLAEWYERDVPFFNYRHVVRPGISGWAQVELGYAAEVEGMTKKLEHDFYYIKNFSFWLDVLIVIRTIKTMLTGFGAR